MSRPRIHLKPADSARTACGRESAATTPDVAGVTCKHCLNQVEIRSRPGCWESFFSKVAGVAHNNADGSSRQQIISRCRVGEELSLVREPGNEFDPNAIKILRSNGCYSEKGKR
jgi:hypothetical protein